MGEKFICKNKIHIVNTGNCQTMNDILQSIRSGIDAIDKLDDEESKKIYFYQIKKTISSLKDELSDSNPIKIEMKNKGVVNKNKLSKKNIKNIRDYKLIYFAFDVNNIKIFDNELSKSDIYFVRIKDNIYTIGKKIGSGGNGKVFLCENTEKEKFAIKIFRNNSPDRKKSFIKEANFLYNNKDENIIKVHDIQISDSDALCYIMDRFDETLEKYLELAIENQDYRTKLTVKDYFFIVNTLLNVVKNLDDQSLFHTDIKLENILINKNSNNKICKLVLADFGCLGDKIRNSKDVIGNIDFKAPEAFGVGEVNVSKHDVYSLGMIFNKILTGERPVGSNYKKIGDMNGFRDYVFIDYIISIMLEQNKNNRPSIDMAVKLFDFYQDLLSFKTNKFSKIKKIEGESTIKICLAFLCGKYGDIVYNGKKLKNDKFLFKFETLKFYENSNCLHVVKGTDSTKYKNESAKIINNPFVVESFYDNNIKSIEFYHMGRYLMIKNSYSNSQSISFYNQENIQRNYNFFSLTKIYDNDIFFDSYGSKGIRNSEEFIVFNSKYLPKNMRIKFLLSYEKPFFSNSSQLPIEMDMTEIQKYPSTFMLHFLFDDILFPIKIEPSFIEAIKSELKLS